MYNCQITYVCNWSLNNLVIIFPLMSWKSLLTVTALGLSFGYPAEGKR